MRVGSARSRCVGRSRDGGWPPLPVWVWVRVRVLQRINRIRFHSPARARPLSPLVETPGDGIAPSLAQRAESHRLIQSRRSWLCSGSGQGISVVSRREIPRCVVHCQGSQGCGPDQAWHCLVRPDWQLIDHYGSRTAVGTLCRRACTRGRDAQLRE